MALRLKYEKVMVKDNTDRVKNAESTIKQQADLIALKVTQENFNALAGRMTSAEASLIVQAEQIALRVSSKDFNGETIASLINLSSSEVKIQASKITLEGLITANNNFKVLADGSIEAKNAKLSGSITATRMTAIAGTRADGSTYDGLDYYGEVGVSDGSVGLGLYDKRFGAGPYMRILELGSGVGFTLVDTNNIRRFSAQSGETNITDALGNVGIRILNASRFTLSPNGKNYIVVTDDTIQIVKDGVVKASW